MTRRSKNTPSDRPSPTGTPDTETTAVTTITAIATAAPDDPPGAGDRAAEAFDALYAHCATALFHQTFLLTGRRALARESVARAFALAWEHWPEVAVDRDPVGWVRAAGYEYALSPWHRLRRAHRRPDPPPAEPADHALLDALLALPPCYRRTLVLHDGLGLGLPETAAETEASTPAAANRLLNARAAIDALVPAPSDGDEAAEDPAPLAERLGALALSPSPGTLPAPVLVRTDSERRARRWTRTTFWFTLLLAGLTLFTLATAPTRHETPAAPARRIGGVPPHGGSHEPEPRELSLEKKLRGELFRGPARLVPGTG
ncbi:sigma factor-like helix-turn-helix DNA-binding protein [Streptomyces sp. NPDC092952]|uniref:sigma factor-like helix-turn-helix DNA-binding protein n=1 Tax=Streptomyces sp. NPDC092952 TaxID=3366018 RepID=UPI003827D99C